MADSVLSPQSQVLKRDGFVQIRVAGDPYEMGVQHGELLRYEIRDLLDAVRRHVLYGQPGVVGWGARRAFRTVTTVLAMYIPLRYRREIAGIAKGADVRYRDLLLINCFDDACANLRLLGSLVGRLACSAFAVTPERTGGDLICGRNLDYFIPSAAGDGVWAATDYMRQHLAVIEHAPADAATFVSVGWPGFVGAATAMSERGLVVANMTVATMRNNPFGMPAPFLYRRVMEEARGLDEAIDMLRRTRRTQGNNVLLASGDEGTAAVVEYTHRHIAVRRAEDGWIAATNHFSHPSMLGQHADLAYLSSTHRLARLGELCATDGQIGADVPSATRFLLDQCLRIPDGNEYCTVLNPCTVYSALFAPAERRMWVRAADRTERTFEEVRIRSC